jgi:murein DD-endopeptidase MepM/ murein hydrolase activator NlpD
MQKVFESRVAAADAAHQHAAEPIEPSPGAAATPIAITDATVAPKAAAVTRAAVVTSQFGWRTDPLGGGHKFHAGQDLRAAYGQDVRAATDGVVTFAGEKPGYGLVVVVSHGSGLETRYAHLSATEVAQGDRILGGDLIARSGQSGRATGPHLHFEVRQDGRPVDPAQVAGLLPAIGARGMSAD